MHNQLSTLTLVFMLVLSMVGATALPAVSADHGANDPGFTGVPSSNINDNIPEHADGTVPSSDDLAGSIKTDHGAGDLQVEVMTQAQAQGLDVPCGPTNTAPHCENPKVALKLTDDVNHEGRQVTVDRQAVVENLGYTPALATVRHESGDTYTVPVEADGDTLTFLVHEFSTNTVTFSGESAVNADPATDGSTYTYDIRDTNGVSNYTIDVTGSTASDPSTDSAGGLSNGDAMALSIYSDLAPTGPDGSGNPEIVLSAVGDEFTHQDDPSSDSNGLPAAGMRNGAAEHSEMQFDTNAGMIEGVYVYAYDYSGSDPVEFDIYAQDGAYDGNYTDGTLVAENVQSETTQGEWHYYEFDQPFRADDAQGSVTIQFHTDSTNTPSDTHFSVLGDTEMTTRFSTTSSTDGTQVARIETGASGITATADTGDSTTIDSVASSETKTTTIDLTTDSSQIDFSIDYGSVNADVNYMEYLQTKDPAVTVNGNTTDYTGTLTDGETVSLTTDTAWLQDGENTIEVSVGDGTEPADAPTPEVTLAHTHDSVDEKTVEYEGEKWSERYNVSRTFGVDTNNAQLTIPFDGHVVEIRNIEKQVDGNGWNSVPESDYSLDGTELTVDLGDVNEGQTVDVRTTGSKVVVENGAITVVEPTAVSDGLDSKIRLDVWDSNSRIDTAGTSGGDLLHMTYNESWSDPGTYSVVDGSTNYLYMPTAHDGATTRVRTTPLAADPGTGDVRLSVEDSGVPFKFKAESGPNSFGDDVEYTFYNTISGETYLLYSETDGVVVDSDTAQSPVYLMGTDDDQLLTIMVDDDETDSSGGSSDENTLVVGPMGDSGGLLDSTPVIMLVSAGIIVALGVLNRRIFGTNSMIAGVVPKNPVFIVASGLVALTTVEHISEGALTQALAGGLEAVLVEIGPLIGLGFGALVLYYLYKRFVKGQDTTVVVRGDRK